LNLVISINFHFEEKLKIQIIEIKYIDNYDDNIQINFKNNINLTLPFETIKLFLLTLYQIYRNI
jgi:hypothetical protein